MTSSPLPSLHARAGELQYAILVFQSQLLQVNNQINEEHKRQEAAKAAPTPDAQA